jgi:hypothetical protein
MPGDRLDFAIERERVADQQPVRPPLPQQPLDRRPVRTVVARIDHCYGARAGGNGIAHRHADPASAHVEAEHAAGGGLAAAVCRRGPAHACPL